MERSTLPPLGDLAFQLDAHFLLSQAGLAPDEDTRDAVEEFAHDLATIQNLPSSRTIPEQIAAPATLLDFIRATTVPLDPPDPTPPERSTTDE